MGADYVLFYTEASLFCILILSLLLINDKMNSTKQEKQIWFTRATFAFILYFISDAFWAAVLGGALPKNRRLIEALNLSNYVLMSLLAYTVFMFIAAFEKMTISRKKQRLYLLPMVVSVLIMLTAYIADPSFWIAENGDLNGLYYPLLIAAPAFYLIIAFTFSMINARKADSKNERKLYRLIGFIPLGLMGLGLLQVLIVDAPTFCFGCTIMWLWFYIQNIQMLISVDALTHLNNRGEINRYMDQVRRKENDHIFIMMIDIDRFKEINDSFGHAEGDRALKLVSETLKQICDPINAPVFLGRYGGDEFTLIIQNPGENEQPDQIVQTLRSALTQKRQENKLLYDLQISVGYAELQEKDDTMKACLIRADERLYEEKRAKGTMR